MEKLVARIVRAYAARSSQHFSYQGSPDLPALYLEKHIQLIRKPSSNDVEIVTSPPLKPHANLVIVLCANRGDDEKLRRDAIPSGYELRAHLYFGFFILPFVFLRFLPGIPVLLRFLFALETRLHPYLNLAFGVGSLSVFIRRTHEGAHSAEISCVIPAFNEALRLPQYLRDITRYFKKRRTRYEIIVVDDGSRDETLQSVSAEFRAPHVRCIALYQNFGKGAAVREGVMSAKGRLVLVADADGATPIGQLAKLEASIAGGSDMAIGSRYLEGSEIGVKQGIVRRIVSRVGNFLIRLLLDLPYKDTQCGFKLFERRAAQYLFRNLTNIRFGFDFEILKKASVLGLSVEEIPVEWNDRAGSKVTFKQTIRVFRELVRFRFAHLLKFAFVGFINTIVDFSVHNALIFFCGIGSQARQLVYMVVAFLVANLLAFCLHSGFTFQRRAAYRRFFAVSVFTLAVAALIFHGLNAVYNPHNSVVLTNIFKLSTVIVSFVTNYFGYKFWVYRYPI